MKHIKSRTNVYGSSGRPSNKSLESVDRIGFLPDSILGIILSFLPTKNAVATSVLSKRWKLVWTTIHNLDLCYEDSLGKQDERDDMRFVGFVNRVLLHHDAGWLNKFRLVWSPRCISSHAISWITTAISKNIHELSLRLETHTLVMYDHFRERSDPEPFVMPICVFSCTTLRFLELNGGISISAAIVVCLPTLETIKLDSVYFQSEEAFEKLIRGCPMLINLLITRHVDILFEFRQDVGFIYKISSASLRLLEIRNDYELDVPFHFNLELEASSLEYLKLVGDVLIPVFFLQNSLSSLVEAEFDIVLGDRFLSNVDICNLVVEAVRELHCAKALILSADIIWALSCATITLSTEFKRLVKLEAETYCFGCSSLRDFIQCSDNLEVLTILRDPMDEEDESDHDHSDDEEDEYDHDDSNDEEDEYDDDDSNDEEDESDHDDSNDEEDEHDHDHSNWTIPLEVPRCLSTSLKKVVLDGYYGNEDEREMIRYMLKHGSALEAMRISCDGSMKNIKKLKLVREICKFPRKSIVCEVEVSDR